MREVIMVRIRGVVRGPMAAMTVGVKRGEYLCGEGGEGEVGRVVEGGTEVGEVGVEVPLV